MNKWKNLYPQTKVIYIIGGCFTAMFCKEFVKAYRAESRKQKKKIREWELMNESAVNAARDRLVQIMQDPDVTAAELWKALEEETEFMQLIYNQPM